MTFLRSLVMAFSCFSRIPVPQVQWRPESMRYLMCFFPLIGVVIGLLIWVWLLVCGVLGFTELPKAAGVALIPLLVTGGIHMDGLCDVVDAQASHAEPERKREILKDPHTGAFATIGAVSYVLAYFAFATQLDFMDSALLIGGLHVVSRCLSSVATVAFPKSSGTGMLATFGESAEKRRSLIVVVVEFVLVGALMVAFAPVPGAVMLVADVVVLVVTYWLSRVSFGGMSGDLAGWFLQVAEIAMLICLVVVSRVVPLA